MTGGWLRRKRHVFQVQHEKLIKFLIADICTEQKGHLCFLNMYVIMPFFVQSLIRAFTISLTINWKVHEMLCGRHLSRAKRAFVFFKHVRSKALLVFTSMEKGICYLFQNLSNIKINKLFMLALLA